jgi:peptide/nickel transport system ATP-binding protein
MTEPIPAKSRPILEVRNVCVRYRAGRKEAVEAVSGVDFGIYHRETLGLVGESGCGKSSLARAIVQLPPPTCGQVLLDGQDLTAMNGASLRAIRPRFQMVFQDPVSSLNPGRQVGKTIAAPLRAAGVTAKAEAELLARRMMAAVGLDPEQHACKYPSQLSGGQCQRVSIARALMTQPDVLICDEPVSALDVSVQAQIINLLNSLKSDFGLSMLFISHDLAVVKKVSDRVAVMYQGAICELAPVETLYTRPAHPYTIALLDAIPRPLPQNRELPAPGAPIAFPLASNPSAGCRFHPRCPGMKPLCVEQSPQLLEIENGRLVACHLPVADPRRST